MTFWWRIEKDIAVGLKACSETVKRLSATDVRRTQCECMIILNLMIVGLQIITHLIYNHMTKTVIFTGLFWQLFLMQNPALWPVGTLQKVRKVWNVVSKTTNFRVTMKSGKFSPHRLTATTTYRLTAVKKTVRTLSVNFRCIGGTKKPEKMLLSRKMTMLWTISAISAISFCDEFFCM